MRRLSRMRPPNINNTCILMIYLTLSFNVSFGGQLAT